jgi:hypothetical protein
MFTVVFVIVLLMFPIVVACIIYKLIAGNRPRVGLGRPASNSADDSSWLLMHQANLMHASNADPVPDVSSTHHSHHSPCDNHHHSHVDTTSHGVDSCPSCGCDTSSSSSSGCDASSN